VSWTSFARVLLSRSAKLKNLLTDPHVVAGIGPIYSDEILWEAGLRYDRTSDSLSSQEIRRLFRALVETLHEAVKHRGTTIDDFPFVDLYGKPGDYQDELKVFAREGEPCRRCRAPIVKSRVANKPLYHCEACQV
jgi:formamidopyrimidine-DNA glycosylase